MNLAKINPLQFITKLFKNTFDESSSHSDTTITHNERLSAYNFLWGYYINSVYNRNLFGGSLDYINKMLGEHATNELFGLINPCEQVIELYAQNTYSGNYGSSFYIDEKINDGVKELEINTRIIEPINKIMKWSNFNLQKERYSRLTALFGNCGIRIVVQVGVDFPNDRVEERRVYLQFEHPALIEDYVSDGRDNITQIMTKHRVMDGELSFSNDDREMVTYRTLLTKEKFMTEKNGSPTNLTGLNIPETENEQLKSEIGDFSNYRNIYGFVPYELSFFRKHDANWGAWAFIGKEQNIDRCNSLATHINTLIRRHINVTYMVTTTGDAPKEFNFGGNRVLLIKRKASLEGVNGDTKVDTLIPNLDINGAIEKLKFDKAALYDSLPELKAVGGEFLANQSGETVAQLRKPAEDKLISFRGNSEHSLKRAIQKALSIGVVLGLWDLGNGTGSIQQANALFQSGQLEFRFNDRPALTITKQEKLTLDQQEQDLENSKQDFGNNNEFNPDVRDNKKSRLITV